MAFKQLNYTAVPNELLDDHLRDLTECELKVLLFILRKTFGWQRDRVTVGLTAISDHVGMDRSNVSRSVKNLCDLGILVAEKNGTDGTTYWPNFDDDGVAPTQHQAGSGVAPTQQKGCAHATLGVAPTQQYKEERNNTERKLKKEPPTPFPDSEVTHHDLIREYKRAKGTKNPGAKDRALFEGLVQGAESPGELLGALQQFLNDDYWREKRFPVAAFCSQAGKYIAKAREMGADSPQDDAERADEAPDAREDAPAPGDAPQTAPAPRDYLADWNRLAPAAATEPDCGSRARANLAMAKADPEFSTRFEEMCKIAQEIRTARPDTTWLTFWWVIDTKAGHGRPNYRRLLKELRGMGMKESSKSGQTDDPMAAMQRTIAAAKERMRAK